MNRRDPRIRQTLERFQSNIENANLNAQAGLYDFVQYYINPCLQSTGACLQDSCGACFPAPQRRARPRHLSRGNRPEQSFDFYNDVWDEDYMGEGEPTERTGLLSGWGAPDLDRLLAGSGGGSGAPSGSEQPRRQAPMNYGSRGPVNASAGGPGRARSGTAAKGGEVNPNEVPASSMFGFLESLPWKIGRRGFTYRPSAANLQENPHRKADDVIGEDGSRQRLLDESDADEDYEDGEQARLQPRRGLSAAIAGKGHLAPTAGGSISGPSRPRVQKIQSDRPISPPSRHGRKRSGTNTSHATTNSLSSRGDLFPSDDEDDAVPIDDEFATALERRTTGSGRRRSSGEGFESSESRSESNARRASSRASAEATQRSPARSIAVVSDEDVETNIAAAQPDIPDAHDATSVNEALHPQDQNDGDDVVEQGQDAVPLSNVTHDSSTS